VRKIGITSSVTGNCSHVLETFGPPWLRSMSKFGCSPSLHASSCKRIFIKPTFSSPLPTYLPTIFSTPSYPLYPLPHSVRHCLSTRRTEVPVPSSLEQGASSPVPGSPGRVGANAQLITGRVTIQPPPNITTSSRPSRIASRRRSLLQHSSPSTRNTILHPSDTFLTIR
jgi:hypothetical protein